MIWLEFLIVDHLHKVRTLRHIASDKKSKIAALEKLGDAGAPANGRVTAQPPKDKVRRPVFMPPSTCPWMNGCAHVARRPRASPWHA